MSDLRTSDRHRTLTTADFAATAERREGRGPDEEDQIRSDSGTSVSSDVDSQNEELAPLFDAVTSQEFRSRWSIVQQGFVDDPAKAVREGDELVAQVIKSLAQTFARQRESLEGNEESTEDLRLAFRGYRSFFDRLLSI